MKRYSLIVLLLASVVGIAAQNSYRPASVLWQSSDNRQQPPQGHYSPATGRQSTWQSTGTGRGVGSAVGSSPYGTYDPRYQGFVAGLPTSGSERSEQGLYLYYDMQSTAAMATSGSQYASTITEVGAASLNTTPRDRRKGFGGDGGSEDPGIDHHGEVHDDPIGTPPLTLIILLLTAYGTMKRQRKIRKLKVESGK